MKRTELERWLRSHGAEPVPGRGRGGHEACAPTVADPYGIVLVADVIDRRLVLRFLGHR